MGLLRHLLKEEQLPLSDELKPQSIKTVVEDYLNSAEFKSEINKNIRTFEEVKELWKSMRVGVIKEVINHVDDYDSTITFIEYIHEALQEFIVQHEDEFIQVIKAHDIDMTLDALLEIFGDYLPDDELSEEDKIQEIIDIILRYDAPSHYDSQKNLDDLYMRDWEIYDLYLSYQGDNYNVVDAGLFMDLEKNDILPTNYEGGIDEMFYEMEKNIETINGVDHIYGEREMRFRDPIEVLTMHKSIGEYWSWFEGGAHAYGAEGDPNTMVLYGMIPVSSVDWRNTFYVNMYNLADEREISVSEYEPILLRRVEFEFDNIDLDHKMDAVIAMYFPHKKDQMNNFRTNEFVLYKNIKKYLKQSNDTLFKSSNISLNLEKDNKYYKA